VPEGELELPRLHGAVRALHQIVDVDYFVPGCPPEPRTRGLPWRRYCRVPFRRTGR
jgi:hypothetical protein